MKTTFRHIAMLRLIPLSDAQVIRWTPTPEIVRGLRAAGHACTARTVQRDLNKLAEKFGLDCRSSGGSVNVWSRSEPLEVKP